MLSVKATVSYVFWEGKEVGCCTSGLLQLITSYNCPVYLINWLHTGSKRSLTKYVGNNTV